MRVSARHFSSTGLTPTRWKNGGGVTREIVCRPEGAGLDDFTWRASIASIAADGPFSTFAGVDRVIMLLDGSGMRLRSADGRIDQQLDAPLQPFAFDGQAALACTLLAGESRDFNVMTRRDVWQAEVSVVRSAQVLPEGAAGVLFAARGCWQVGASAADEGTGAGDDVTLSADTGVWWDDAPQGWHVAPREADAALLVVRLWPRQPQETR